MPEASGRREAGIVKCPKCKQELVRPRSQCDRCIPVDTEVSTCECGGFQDEFRYVEYVDDSELGIGGYGEVVEYRCRVCHESEYGDTS